MHESTLLAMWIHNGHCPRWQQKILSCHHWPFTYPAHSFINQIHWGFGGDRRVWGQSGTCSLQGPMHGMGVFDTGFLNPRYNSAGTSDLPQSSAASVVFTAQDFQSCWLCFYPIALVMGSLMPEKKAGGFPGGAGSNLSCNCHNHSSLSLSSPVCTWSLWLWAKRGK